MACKGAGPATPCRGLFFRGRLSSRSPYSFRKTVPALSKSQKSGPNSVMPEHACAIVNDLRELLPRHVRTHQKRSSLLRASPPNCQRGSTAVASISIFAASSINATT